MCGYAISIQFTYMISLFIKNDYDGTFVCDIICTITNLKPLLSVAVHFEILICLLIFHYFFPMMYSAGAAPPPAPSGYATGYNQQYPDPSKAYPPPPQPTSVPPTTFSASSSDVETGTEWAGDSFSDKAIRRAFIRKVSAVMRIFRESSDFRVFSSSANEVWVGHRNAGRLSVLPSVRQTCKRDILRTA